MPKARSDHKDFSMGGNDELSDHFIEGVIQNAPKTKDKEMKPRRKAEDEARLEDWKANIYSTQIDEEAERKKRCTCGSVWVGIISVVLLLLGLASFVIGIVEQNRANILPLCPGCTKFVTGLYVAGAILLFMALMGLAAAKTRNPCIATPFAFLILIVGLALLALAIAAILFATGTSHLDIVQLWENAVQNDAEMICTMQSDLRCSGYQFGCCYSATPIGNFTRAPPTPPPAPTNSTPPAGRHYHVEALLEATSPALGAPTANTSYCWSLGSNGLQPDWVGRVCSAQCASSNTYITTCDSALQAKIKELLAPISGVLFPLGFIMLITGISAIKMSCCK